MPFTGLANKHLPKLHSWRHCRWQRVLTLAALLLIMPVTSTAEQKKVFGDYEVHYSVVPTRFIPEEVARVYQITRGNHRMLLNISVRKIAPAGSTTETLPQAATVSGTRHDLMRPFELTFREITEQGAIYYLSDFSIINEEILRFTINVGLDSGENFSFEFVKKLYIDR